MVDEADHGRFYGQFGEAIYDSEDKEWHFQRVSSNIDNRLQLLGEVDVVLPSSSTAHPVREPDGKGGPARRREKQAKALFESFSELHPASDLLPELARVSEAVEDATERHDPTIGNLLAFGTIYGNARKYPMNVVAFPSGATGGDLKVAQVQSQKRGWADSEDAWLDVPTIYGAEAIWRGPGVGIKSIHMSQPTRGKEVLLAVRLIAETLILQPIFAITKRVSGGKLDLKLVASIDISQTGGLPHADLSFSPWSPQRLALVDQSGTWSSWKIKAGSSRKDPETLTREASKNVDSSEHETAEDGWASIEWVSTGETLAVCTRRKMRLVNVEDGLSTDLLDDDLRLDLLDRSDWILDIVAFPSQPNRLCILTSTAIRIIQIGAEEDITKLMQFRHFRNGEDVSLRISLFRDQEDDCLLLLRSAISPIIISYRFTMRYDERMCIGDPSELGLPFGDRQATASSALNILLAPISTQAKRIQFTHSKLQSWSEQGVRFYSMMVLRKDLCLLQAMFSDNRTSKAFPIEPTSWESDLSGERHEEFMDDFVVGYSDLDDAQLRTKAGSRYTKRRAQSRSKSTDPNRTVNYKLTTQSLQDAPNQVVGKMFLSVAQKLLRNRQGAEAATFRTLREMIDEEPIANDIEGTAADIDNLRVQGGRDDGAAPLLDDADDPNQSLQLTLEPIRIPRILGLNLIDQPERLQRFYESVRRSWVTPLPEDLPDATLEAKEQLTRSVTTGVTLASYVLRPEPLQEEDHVQTRGQSQNWDIPVRSGASRTTPSRSFDGLSQRSTLPTPSTSRSPSIAAGSSHPSTFAAPEFARLSRYTSFSEPAPPVLPRSLRRVLTHWTPGRDPADYDWLSISRNVSRREEEDEGEEMTEKERKRLQRRTERYVERQRREVEEGQRQQALASQAPTIVTASQPQLVAKGASQSTAAAGSGKQFGMSQAPATQVLPGRHGGRPLKKKRKSGF